MTAIAKRPAAEGERPAAEGERPAAEGERPAAEGERPAAEGERPAAEGERPAAEGERPAAEGEISRSEIRDFFDLYYDTLDDVRLREWPDLFVTDCLYRVIPRENYEQGYALCTMQAESRGMLQDRVTGLLRTQMYAPRYYRRFPGPLRLVGTEAGGVRTRHNILLIQTLIDKQSDIVLTGACYDLLVRAADGTLRLKERIVVFDSEMVPNSLIYPV